MRKYFFIIVFAQAIFRGFAQEPLPVSEQQLESLGDMDEAMTKDDSYFQQLDSYRKHPLNINDATAGDLKEFFFITALQAELFVDYRKLLGKFISIYELQSVPGWDVATIKKILPFVTVSNAMSTVEDLRSRLQQGDYELLVRASRVLEKSAGFDKTTSGTKYLGNNERIFFRYRYQYKNLLQYGIVGDKDAGEQFLKGKQKTGFDFYSFHFFARNIRRIESLALGDFTVNMGQGLIQWQTLAFKKSAEVLSIKRQSAVLKPYHSAGEFYFHRGAGVTVRFGRIQGTVFTSLRKISSNISSDSSAGSSFITSFLNTGYYRTANENANRNNVKQFSFGGNMMYTNKKFQVGVNSVYHSFSMPVKKRNEPYNLFAFSGRSWYNVSVDYSYTIRNLHFFGEMALDKNIHPACINGLLISVDPRVDLAFVHRNINKAYQAVYGNAFTENTSPVNEKGIYAGITVRPFNGWKVDMYADVYQFPWLRYLADEPCFGKDFLIQLTYTPNKQLELYTKYRQETKQSNQSENTSATNFLVSIPRQNWRVHINFKISTSFTIRNRVEMIWYDKKEKPEAETGFLTFVDILYNPLLKPYSGNLRLQYFETDDFNSRIYVYEQDVLSGFSIPAFFDKGSRYYLNFNYDLRKNLSFWLRWSQTIYKDKTTIGSGLDEIKGNKKSELKLQCMWRIL